VAADSNRYAGISVFSKNSELGRSPCCARNRHRISHRASLSPGAFELTAGRIENARKMSILAAQGHRKSYVWIYVVIAGASLLDRFVFLLVATSVGTKSPAAVIKSISGEIDCRSFRSQT